MVPRLSVLLRAARSPAWRRTAFFLAAGAVVVLLHVALLATLAPAWIDPEEPLAAAPVLSVRSVPLAPPPVPQPMPLMTAAAPLPPLTTAAAPVATARAVTRPPSAPRRVASAPAESLDPTSPAQPVAPPDAAPAADERDAMTAPPTPAAAGATPAIEVPVYETRLSAAGSWSYLLQRGVATGEARLSWEPDVQQRYSMRLEGWIAGVPVLDWRSTGALDHAGIAPERFAIRRRGKDSQAANFQRDTGKITFSGPTHELALLPGVQDRLSWMLQLPAVIEAAPQRFRVGSNVVLMVIGARGGADVWTFAVVASEPLDGLATLKLVREALKPHDVRVEVWLDPARAHLPVRALLSQATGGAPLQLTLQKGSTGP
jgi:hypothetical protein